ncbi:MAG: hypothetical protein H7Y04_00130 [Verrucomicrobia bacterium]|nr:hypothetical protein [Cytophagales bacterium]
MNESTVYMAINSPRPHQAVITKLIARLYVLFETGQIHLQPYPETMLDSGRSSPVPDVILVNPETEQTEIIIEISNKTGFKNDCNKVKKLIDEQNYDIREGFVYNYQTEEWFKYELNKGIAVENTSFSEIVIQDFNKFL